jgi:hypothetical protein
MAFSQAITDRQRCPGSMRVAMGTWTGASATTGELNTGLAKVHGIALTPKGSASAAQCAHDETLPCDGDAVTINFTSGTNGTWMAWGY